LPDSISGALTRRQRQSASADLRNRLLEPRLVPHQDVIFLDETDPMSSPMKAKGVGELGICGVAASFVCIP
jgi:CO/xanthine dehydrogenase Mo-binding subunit